MAQPKLERLAPAPPPSVLGYLRVRHRGLLGRVDRERRKFFCGTSTPKLGFPPNISPNLAQTAEKLGPKIENCPKMAIF